MKRTLMLIMLAAGLSASPAIAGNTHAVRYADLDLGKADGVRTLDRRIAAAAVQACGAMTDTDPAGKNRIRACRKATVAQAQAARDRVIADQTTRRYASRR